MTRDFIAARLRFTAARYDTEARLNQSIANIYELQVRKSNASAERHHRRSRKIFYGMLAAQAAVIIATGGLGPTDDDRTTFLELGLGEITPAIGGVDGQPGPKTSVERSTIFGNTYVRELTLASETIFTGPVISQRRQVGCTRFSFVPDGSRVPRRYYCQPDLALADCAQKAGKSSVDHLTQAQQAAVIARVTPVFTSERYGDPEYGQLSLTCAEEIATGTEDGSEMGAFCQLKQPQRKANLESTLEEYLRFGLEAGIFDVILKRNEEQGENNEG